MFVRLNPLDDWRFLCPCGAKAEHEYGICRKCQARATWRRRHATRTRRTVRRDSEAVTK